MSKYFKINELCKSASHPELAKVPDSNSLEYSNLLALMIELDLVREKYGKPIYVSSGYRSKALNQAVKGSPTSAHLKGNAADLYSGKGVEENLRIVDAILDSGINFDQIIIEYPTISKSGEIISAKWIHLGLTNGTPRWQILYYDGKSYKNVKLTKKTNYKFEK